MSKLSLEQVKLYLGKVPGWKLVEDRMALSRTYHCRDFGTAISFVNRVAELLEYDSQHVEIHVNGGLVTFTLATREAKGLTGKDFALAQTISKVS
ncbi:pterin-4-alpha-carbinolamine dehydratase [Brevibacillus choshinensis]|uniref:4a-hydroxytetrahydrobiopterin dehydratase n=1 Tax=Brevibacillus choshinensis TaxID=54911 RepID=A0ABR5NBV8_BRECH|nr:4a-hydroxytetrahydrobiopterin dehydratase [Brevibacillus choshinensis]KQL49033.1 pterin-4-alpha-carbinolamine dehydratase [Brevibacillus choshinensis]